MAALPTKSQLQSLPPEYLAQDKSHQLLISSSVFLVVQFVIFSGFIASRLIHGKGNGWVLWTLVIAAYSSVLGLSITGILWVKIGGEGRHLAYLMLTDPAIIERNLKIETAVEYLYVSAITFSKFVICTFYLKIFVNRQMRWVAWAVVFVIAGTFVSLVVSLSTICQPYEFKWNKSIDGRCGNVMAVYRYVSIPGICTDVVILVLPFPMVWHLKVGRLKKFGIFITFLTGSMGIIVAILRMREFFITNLLSDSMYLGASTMIYTTAEPSAYFVCACLLGMRPLLEVVARKSGLAVVAQTAARGMRKSSETRQLVMPFTDVTKPKPALHVEFRKQSSSLSSADEVYDS